MKRLALLLVTFGIVLASTAQRNDPVIVRIGDTDIHKSEFVYNYLKNNNESILESKSVDEYLELYIKFKLKVLDAKAHGLDTTESFKSEYRTYRNQLTEPYLIDKEVENELYRQAYEHMKQDCEVWHVLIGLEKTESDTTEAYEKALKVRELLINGGEFSAVADEYSTDQSVKTNHGYLGYLTAMQTIWPFEKAMYELPLNQISMPIRTAFGYHIIKVTDRREAWGQVHAYHIMKICHDKMPADEQDNAYRRISYAWQRLLNGEEFEMVARTTTDDRATAGKGGDLNWFSIGRMVPEFEKVAFSLKEGEFSAPFKTRFGWHIVKVVEKRQHGTFEQEKPRIQQMMQYDYRSTAAQIAFVEKLKEQYNYQLNWEVADLLYNTADDNLIDPKIVEKIDKPLFTFDGHKVWAKDFLPYCNLNKDAEVDEKIQAFVFETLLAYEDSKLEEKHPEFKLLMQEYYEGMLLFEISNQEVWSKATSDIKGLEAYYKKHRSAYKWKEPRFKGYIVRCKDQQTADLITAKAKSLNEDELYDFIYKELNNDSTIYARLERGLWKKGDNKIIDSIIYKVPDVKCNLKADLPIAITIGKKLKAPTSYKDVKGQLSTDYQTVLENRWVNNLMHNHDIVIYEDIVTDVKDEYPMLNTKKSKAKKEKR